MNYKIFITLLLSVLIFPLNTEAQQEFSQLSAKQKIKLGKKEQKEAKKDPEYLQMMNEGMAYFQSKEYDKAIAKYEAANNRRPNNVYPMVMLEDINVAKELISVETKPETVVILPDNTESRGLETKESDVVVNSTIDSNQDNPIENPEIIETQTEDPVVINTPEKLEKQVVISNEVKTIDKKEEKVYENDGIYRETLKEGSATIYQITIVKMGKATVLREVVHTWGGEFYFLDQDPITKQEYKKLVTKLEE
ncbi:MAG: hypothetical protein DRI54_00850 [Bacteroidetes bacterium]|nr:MAG: hypothetical protein DRI54_00850 [Bacteroidota bacterium]